VVSFVDALEVHGRCRPTVTGAQTGTMTMSGKYLGACKD
jgi:hypothetical protein